MGIKIEQLTFTRFIAAFSIIIYHFGTNIFPFNHFLISAFFKQADSAVSYFFFLSGFILVIAYSNKTKINLVEFYKNRIARIYPIYFLSTVFFILVSNRNIKLIILNSLMIQSWIPLKAILFNF
ncbi:acyltransferase family protein [Aquimarina agarilytica]|uniref:acyltransferase family protein n=1 Tax=Aquimarina agarilytica TaxID=1087449 RepID=UPI0012F7A046